MAWVGVGVGGEGSDDVVGLCIGISFGFRAGVGSGWLNWGCGGSRIGISVGFGVGVVGG